MRTTFVTLHFHKTVSDVGNVPVIHSRGFIMKVNSFRDNGAAAYSPDKNPAVIYVMKTQPGRP